MPPTWKRAYAHEGVFIPYVEGQEEDYHSDYSIAQDGFLLVQIMRKGLLVVQSVNNGMLYFLKTLRKVGGTGVEAGHYEFTYDEPPDFRVSTHPDAIATLPDQPPFPHLALYQRPSDRRWDLYFQYYNGGTIEAFIERYYRERTKIPEHFIWHVTVELCRAIAFLYYGDSFNVNARDDPVVYHRDIHPSNILIHYPPRGRGRVPTAGNKSNAFPQIILCDFGESALQGDDPNDLKPGQFEEEDEPADFEDVYQLGCVLRSLCMAHILFPNEDEADPNNNIPGQLKDETQEWNHRPDSRRLANVNLVGPAYSNTLINALRNFEWPGQENNLIEEDNNRDHQPSVQWVVYTLLPLARGQVRAYTEGPHLAGYYDAMDVSWTKPFEPMPYVVDRANDNLEADLRRDIQRHDFEFCGMEYPLPNTTRPLPEPPGE
ncbi:hypothetical protein F4776DRAFT_670578 [Hypoxylon sp. NC0597]|nr:hypothetical protein F4776DRAFT_670578 [Hypoxylon sp. NC0597]